MQNGMCYDSTPCHCSAVKEGPLCWGHCQPGTKACGALCLDDRYSCTGLILEASLNVFQYIFDLATMSMANIRSDIKGVT